VLRPVGIIPTGRAKKKAEMTWKAEKRRIRVVRCGCSRYWFVVGSIDDDAYALRQAYLRAGVVSPKWAADALHVAVVSVNGCHAIVV